MFKGNMLLWLLIFSFFMLNFRCEKDLPLRPFDQTFEIPVSITPLKRIYSLTDTIWLETEVPNKMLWDAKTNRNILVDTANISFSISYYGFGIKRSNPPGGFCNVITSNGVNINRRLSDWASEGFIQNYGCTEISYRVKIGFKPNYKGTYSLLLPKDLLLGSCANKSVAWHATTSYKFTTTDLNLDVFNDFANHENFGSDKKRFFTDKIKNQETFVFRVE